MATFSLKKLGKPRGILRVWVEQPDFLAIEMVDENPDDPLDYKVISTSRTFKVFDSKKGYFEMEVGHWLSGMKHLYEGRRRLSLLSHESLPEIEDSVGFQFNLSIGSDGEEHFSVFTGFNYESPPWLSLGFPSLPRTREDWKVIEEPERLRCFPDNQREFIIARSTALVIQARLTSPTTGETVGEVTLKGFQPVDTPFGEDLILFPSTLKLAPEPELHQWQENIRGQWLHIALRHLLAKYFETVSLDSPEDFRDKAQDAVGESYALALRAIHKNSLEAWLPQATLKAWKKVRGQLSDTKTCIQEVRGHLEIFMREKYETMYGPMDRMVIEKAKAFAKRHPDSGWQEDDPRFEWFKAACTTGRKVFAWNIGRTSEKMDG